MIEGSSWLRSANGVMPEVPTYTCSLHPGKTGDTDYLCEQGITDDQRDTLGYGVFYTHTMDGLLCPQRTYAVYARL